MPIRASQDHLLLANLAERNARLLASCRELASAALTPAERASVLPNAALVDRENIQLLLSPPQALPREPSGATDLTNPINVPKVAVHLHPVLSLQEEVVRWLESRNQAALARRGRALIQKLEDEHRRSLVIYGLPEEWPNLRAQWEKGVEKVHPLPAGVKKLSKHGVGPERLAYAIAKYSRLVPNLDLCDLDLVMASRIAEKGDSPEVRATARRLVKGNITKARNALNNWAALNAKLKASYRAEVEEPMERQGRAWVRTCKSVDEKTEQELVGYLTEVEKAAAEQPEVERVVIGQAVETAFLAMVTPDAAERAYSKRAGTLEKVGNYALNHFAKAGIGQAKEFAEQGALSLMGPTAKLTYFVAKFLFQAAGKPGEKVIEKQAGKLLQRGTEALRDHVETERLLRDHEQSLSERVELFSVRNAVDDAHLPHLIARMGHEGERTAALLARAYAAAASPAVGVAMRERVEKIGLAHAVGELAAIIHGNVHASGNWGLPETFSLDPGEDSATRRAALALAARVEFKEAESFSVKRSLKGPPRLDRHWEAHFARWRKCEHAVQPRQDGVGKLSEEHALQELAYAIDELTEPGAAIGASVTPLGMSRMITAVERCVQRAGSEVKSRNERGDWPLLLAINSGLAAGSILPQELTQELSVPVEVLEPLPAAESRAQAKVVRPRRAAVSQEV